eukprot:9142545-Pyramimonas_sp.AAC.1
MVRQLRRIAGGLSDWSEGCSCHSPLIDENKDYLGRLTWAKRRRIVAQSFGDDRDSPCPMKGKRFPELVAGELENVCNELADSSWLHLLTDVNVYLSPDQWNIVQQDFTIAKLYMKSCLDVKFDWLKRLPRSLAVLAHPDADLARRRARAIAAEYDAADPAAQAFHHSRA